MLQKILRNILPAALAVLVVIVTVMTVFASGTPLITERFDLFKSEYQNDTGQTLVLTTAYCDVIADPGSQDLNGNPLEGRVNIAAENGVPINVPSGSLVELVGYPDVHFSYVKGYITCQTTLRDVNGEPIREFNYNSSQKFEWGNPGGTDTEQEVCNRNDAIWEDISHRRVKVTYNGDSECLVGFAAYNTHGFANLNVPGAYQTLWGEPAWATVSPQNRVVELEIADYDPYCYTQMDVVLDELDGPRDQLFPNPLRGDNQGYQFAHLVPWAEGGYTITFGTHTCESTPTPTMTSSPTPSPTPTSTASKTPTPTMTPSVTPSSTPSQTPSSTPTATPTDEEPTSTPTVTPTGTRPTETPTPTSTASPSATPTTTPTEDVVKCSNVQFTYDVTTNRVTGTTTGVGDSWKIYVRGTDQLIFESAATSTNFSFTPTKDVEYEVRWYRSGQQGEGVCVFKPHTLYIPYVPNHISAICVEYTVSIPIGTRVNNDQQITFTVWTVNATQVRVGSQVVNVVNNEATLTLVGPGVYTLEIFANDRWVTAPNCVVEYKEPLPTEAPVRCIVIWDDPLFRVEEEDCSLDWQRGIFESDIDTEDADGAYHLTLSGPIREGKRHADAVGLVVQGTQYIFRFQQVCEMEETDRDCAFVFHSQLEVKNDTTPYQLVFPNLGTLQWRQPNTSPLTVNINGTDQSWSRNFERDLADGSYLRAGVFSDDNNSETQAFGLLQECIGIVSLRENVPSSKIPTVGKFLIAVYPGCETGLDGFLAPLTEGKVWVRNPNDYRYPATSLASTAQSTEEVSISIELATEPMPWE